MDPGSGSLSPGWRDTHMPAPPTSSESPVLSFLSCVPLPLLPGPDRWQGPAHISRGGNCQCSCRESLKIQSPSLLESMVPNTTYIFIHAPGGLVVFSVRSVVPLRRGRAPPRAAIKLRTTTATTQQLCLNSRTDRQTD